MSDYNFRGITQSDHGRRSRAYFEPRYNINKDLQLYAGIGGYEHRVPERAAAEIDFYGGIRPTFGDFAFDLGVCYYFYPGETQFCGVPGGLRRSVSPTFANGNTTLKPDTDFWEFYGKVTYGRSTTSRHARRRVFYSPSWLNTGADGLYLVGHRQDHRARHMSRADLGMYVPASSAITGSAPPTCRGSCTGSSGWNLPDYYHLERRRRLHLQGVHARPALSRHRPEQGRCNVSHRRPHRRRRRRRSRSAINTSGWARTGAARRSSPLSPT